MTAEEPDPERLLAEALRAQAVRAPMPAAPSAEAPTEPPAQAAGHVLPPLSGAEPGYGLLSGHEPDTMRGPATPYQAQSTQFTGEPVTTTVRRRPRPLAAGWIVLFALVLGVAAGVVAGLLTVL